MLKIHNSEQRNLPVLCQQHYFGIKNSVLNNIARSGLRQIIKDELKNRLKSIIIETPQKLLKIEEDIYSFMTIYRSNRNSTNKIIRKIFNYENFSKRQLDSKWNLYLFAKGLNVNTCVYCNRQYTFTIGNHAKKITRPQFDHFFPKDKHPLLSLSFFNLIPCCSICNGSALKGNKELTLDKYIHPYEDEFGKDGVFTWIPLDYKAIVGRSNKMDIKILEKPTGINKVKISNQKKLFKIEEIYNEHSDYVREIILKAHITKGKYFKWLQKLFGNGISKEEIYRLALANYHNDFELDKRVLSKLTKNIAEEIGLIE